MVAWAGGGKGSGTLQLIDVEHDTVSNKQDNVHSYTINGYGGTDPLTIQDYPGRQFAYIFADGGNPPSSAASFQPVNTAKDSSTTPFSGIAPGTTSAYITDDFSFVYSVSPTTQHATVGYLSVLRTTDNAFALIPLPNANKLAPSPGAVSGTSSLLIFAANANAGSNTVYQLVGVGQDTLYDCTQQLIPIDVHGNLVPFDQPVNAVYSSDGTSAFVLNCGPECGGTTSSVTILNTANLAVGAQAAYKPQLGCNVEASYTPAPYSPTAVNVAVPAVTTAIQLGTTLFVAGQQVQSNGSLMGVLTAIDLPTLTTSSTVIGNGNHFRMRFADNNTLWIAANGICNETQATSNGGSAGCISMVPLQLNASGTGYSIQNAIPVPTVSAAAGVIAACQPPTGPLTSLVPCAEPNQGAAGGLAPIIGYDKIYTVEGGSVYIYSVADGSAISNIYVQVPGYAHDIAFIDGQSNTAP